MVPYFFSANCCTLGIVSVVYLGALKKWDGKEVNTTLSAHALLSTAIQNNRYRHSMSDVYCYEEGAQEDPCTATISALLCIPV
jgi:hypothetical protein